ncbi:MAG: glycoside hydrolase family 10 protein [Synechococcus sp.]
MASLGQARPTAASPRLDRVLLNQRSDVGVWLTNSPSRLYYSRRSISSAMERLERAGFTRVIPNVWSRGTTFHHSQFAPTEPPLERVGVDLDPICTLAAEGRKRRIQVMPWFEYGLMEPADSAVLDANPDWVLARADGQRWMELHGNHRMSWLNPAHPEVRQRFIGLVVETLQRCPLHGLQLDDHFAWPVEFGYDDATRALYREQTGLEVPLDHSNRHWMRWRRQQLTGLLRELRQRLKQEGLPVTISLSPGPFRQAYNLWLQDWELWAMGGLIDELVVQNYAYSVQGFARDLDQPALRKARDWGVPTQIGILAGFGRRTTSMADLRSKIQLARSRNHGVIFFYWEGLCGRHRPPTNNNQCWANWQTLISE